MGELAQPVGIGLAARGEVADVVKWSHEARRRGLDSCGSTTLISSAMLLLMPQPLPPRFLTYAWQWEPSTPLPATPCCWP